MLAVTDLFDTQSRCIDFICSGEDSLIWADVGAGKTVIALSAIQRLGGRWIVFAPLRVADDVWVQETDEWEHLLKMSIVTATSGPRTRAAAARGPTDVVVTNYENLAWWADSDLLRYFDGIVYDEVDKLKDPRTKRFKSLKNHVPLFKHRIGMTGTPASTKLLDLWAQTYVVDGGQSFGPRFDQWKKAHFYPSDYQQHVWKPFPIVTEKYVMGKLEGLVERIEATRRIDDIIETPTRYITLPADGRAAYRELERQLFTRLKSGEKIDAANMAVLTGKLNQIASGFSYTDGKKTVWHTKGKFEELDSLISELQGQPLMIVYHFHAQRDELIQRYGDRLIMLADDAAAVDKWNKNEIELLGLHPASGGHGLNMQKGGAHHIVFLTKPWSAGTFMQVVGRLNRTGQVNQVYVHSIAMADTVDLDIANVVDTRMGEQADILNAMMRRTEARYAA